MTTTLSIRFATPDDIAALHRAIERAYRGDSARQGWTHEADLLDDQRTDEAALAAIIADPRQRLLIAEQDGATIGCVQISDKGQQTSYLGLLCVDPLLQAGGLGKQLIEAAEQGAVSEFGARQMEMTVIDRRVELIRYYERRGYCVTGEKRDFPVLVNPPLAFDVLTKRL